MLAHLSQPPCRFRAAAPGSPKLEGRPTASGGDGVLGGARRGAQRTHTFTLSRAAHCRDFPGRSNVTVPSRSTIIPSGLQGQGTVVPPLPEHQARADLPSLDPSERAFEPQKARRAPRAPIRGLSFRGLFRPTSASALYSAKKRAASNLSGNVLELIGFNTQRCANLRRRQALLSGSDFIVLHPYRYRKCRKM